MKKRGLGVRIAALLLAGALMAGCGETAVETPEPASTERAVLDLTSNATPEPVSTEAPKDDWSGKYDNYFEVHPLDGVTVEAETISEGVKVFLRMSFIDTEELSYVRMCLWEGKRKKEFDKTQELNAVTLYCYNNGDVYLMTELKGKPTIYQKATGFSWDQLDELTMGDHRFGIKDDVYEEAKYDHDETIDGVVYDVLASKVLRQTESKANRWVKYYFFINRETQAMDRFQIKDSTEITDYYVFPIEETTYTELPEGFKSAKKIKAEDLILWYAISYLKINMSAFGQDPDAYNLERTYGLK